MGKYVYEYYNSLYFNLTNKCSNNCDFCVRNHTTDLNEKQLWIVKEPTFEDVLKEIPTDLSKYDELVFCGYGEPTYRIDLIKELVNYLKKFNKTIRINTNGQGNLINKRNIVEDLKGIDIISISLNAPNKKLYQIVCHSIFGEKAFEEILNFALECKNNGFEVIFTLVDTISKEDIINTQQLCKNLNIPLRIRNYY